MEIYNCTDYQFAILNGRLGFPGHSATFIVKGCFQLNNNGTVQPVEEQIFPTGDEYYPDDDEQQGSIRYPSDFSYFKARADMGVVGHCYAPSGTVVTSSAVRVAINDRARELHVFGDRFWERKMGVLGVTEPAPFEKMELRYENSFGGQGFEANPAGKGVAKVALENGATVWPLPNIENPQQRIGTPDHRPEPAGFGPLNATWQYRRQKLGTYDKKWLENKWPWFPDDFDSGYFNAAPPAQQLDTYLNGDESLQFVNMHPEIADYRTRLPGLRVRCFTRTHSADPAIGKSFQEIAMNLDTLWVDMDAEQLVLVWRGWSRVDSGEMEDIQDILVLAEALDGQSMEVEDCYAVLNQCIAELDQDMEEEEPERSAVPVEAEPAVDIDGIIAGAEATSRQAMIDAGVDPDNLPQPSDADKRKEAELLAELGIERQEENPLTREHIATRVLNRESFFQEDLTGLELGGIDFSGIDLRETNLSGIDLKHSNFSSADLTGAVLNGADLSRVDLQAACLRDADLTGALLTEANLAGANLEGTVLESCNSQSANFENVQAAEADFSNARLRGSRFSRAVLTAASFEEADLNHTVMTGAQLQNARFDKATAIYANFSGSDMTGARASDSCDFSGAVLGDCQLEGANFEGARCIQTDFSYADMHDVNLIGADLKDANLTCADLRQAKLAKAGLENASLVQANLYEASLEQAVLEKTDFRGANLYAAEFLDAEISHSDFEQANLKMTKLERTG
ncbi:MAG TPA: DUF2169 domain-containing protein [Gammaproteobacteria bacterium]|nr:DUF2169 domain-containing protein [Gammaproteobacteria bacterium]